jgi:hypothetical protein
MQIVKTIVITMICLGLLAVLALYGGTRWLSNNQDVVREEVRKTVGLDKMKQAECDHMEARFRMAWDEAVENRTIDSREAQLNVERERIDQLCKSN